MLSANDIEFVHEVADRIETVVIANATPGRWRAGDGSSAASRFTLRVIPDGTDDVYHLGTAIDKPNQRAMMGGQPKALNQVVAVLRAVDTTTPDPLGAHLLELSRMYNSFMSLGVDTADSDAATA